MMRPNKTNEAQYYKIFRTLRLARAVVDQKNEIHMPFPNPKLEKVINNQKPTRAFSLAHIIRTLTKPKIEDQPLTLDFPMASDDQDSRRKHRRAPSSDDEAEKSSKRHKHRHHHRHHRHRHSSKKREEESAVAVEDVEAPPPPVMLSSSGANSSRPAEDVEEGEILDEDGVGGRDDAALTTKADSGAESGEIEAPGVRDHSDNRNLVCSDCPYLFYFSLIVPLLVVWSLKYFEEEKWGYFTIESFIIASLFSWFQLFFFPVKLA